MSRKNKKNKKNKENKENKKDNKGKKKLKFKNSFNKFFIEKYLKDLDSDLSVAGNVDNTPYKAKKVGEGKVSSFEIKGLVDSFVMVAEWPSGEGYDISIETSLGKNLGYKTKTISIHLDELECMLRAINDLNKN